MAGVEDQRAARADAIDDAGAHAGETQRAHMQLGAIAQFDDAGAQAFQRDVLEGHFSAVDDQMRVLAQRDFVVRAAVAGFFFGNGCRFIGGKRNGIAHDGWLSGDATGWGRFFFCFLPDRRFAPRFA
ncbi:hypothetical protein D3C71_1288310 [compost metagenome]